jgi:hypothetical protein
VDATTPILPLKGGRKRFAILATRGLIFSTPILALTAPLEGLLADPAYTIQGYAEECRVAIGPIPPFSCASGEPSVVGPQLRQYLADLAKKVEKPQIIPITKNDQPIDWHQITPSTACDRPKYLGDGTGSNCQPFSRIGQLPGVNASLQPDANIQWAFICRNYGIGQDDDLFDDVAVIGHNKASGATCFYQALGEKDTRRVPSPLEKDDETPQGFLKAKDFWLSPEDTADSVMCYTCHHTDAFIHTPHVDQVCELEPGTTECKRDLATFDAIPIVPKGPKRNSTTEFMYWVGSQFFNQWPKPQAVEVDADNDARPDKNACTECHRVGRTFGNRYGTFYCDQLLAGAEGKFLRHLSPEYKRADRSRWMPPVGGDRPPLADNPTDAELAAWLAEYDRRFSADAAAIHNCCLNPTSRGCMLVELPENR